MIHFEIVEDYRFFRVVSDYSKSNYSEFTIINTQITALSFVRKRN